MLGLLKILAAFAAIVFLVRKKVQLGTAMLLGSLVLALLSWASRSFFDSGTVITPGGFLSIVGQALWDRASSDPASVLKLIGVIVLVLVLSHCLDKSGQMNRILRSFQALVGDVRIVLISLPALIGLLPMPGGAVFSAPMVEEAQKHINLTATKKTLINYWFRHLWEYSWPLYPGLLLAAELARKSGLDLSVFKLASVQFPLSAAALLGGILFIMRDVPRPAVTSPGRSRFRFAAFAVDLSPIVIIITIVVFLYTVMGMGSKDSLLAGLVVAILLTLGITALRQHTSPTPPWAVLKSISVMRILSLVYVVIALMIFRGTIQKSGSVEEISAMMRAYHVPLFPFAVLLSFISGLVTGLAMAYVAIVFPILSPLVLQVTSEPLPYLVLAFGSGFIGVLFSPVHVCLILTHEYFTSDFSPVYRRMIAPTLVVFATLVALFFVLYLTPLSA
jgi:integral membrane protein (TIGR00529 family)